jgi:metallophosphoesterase superfamily enzyme
LVVAGDLLEDGRCRAALAEFRDWLTQTDVELLAVVPGNHDRRLATDGHGLPLAADGFVLGRWHVVHGDGPLPDGPVVHGHEHPWAAFNGRLGGPCYLVGDDRLVLPAYSADAAGVNVLGIRRWRDYRCGVIAGDRVLDFGLVGELRPGR